MKSVKALMKGLATLALIVFGLSSAAEAQVVRTPVTQNGVTCYRHDGGSYPENGYFYYCGTSAANEAAALSAIRTAFDNYGNVNIKLSNRHVQFFIFKSVIDEATFGASKPPTQQDLMNYYNAHIGLAGVSTPGHSDIFEGLAKKGGYPNTVALTAGEIEHAVLHEMGHQYDYTGGWSTNEEYNRVVTKDQHYMDQHAVNPSAATLRATYSYYLVPNADSPDDPWVETYAEEFAQTIINAHPAGITADPVGAAALNPYFKCSMEYVKTNIEDDRTPTDAEYAPLGCGAALAGCSLISTSASTFPYSNAYYCGTNPNADQANINAFFDTLLQNTFGTFGTQNAQMGAKFYLFPTVTAANTALSAMGLKMDTTVASETFNTAGVSVVVETLNSAAVPINNKTEHEMGVWLNLFAKASAGGSQFASDSSGFNAELNADITSFNKMGGCAKDVNGVAVFAGQKDYKGALICNGTVLSSTYSGLTNWNVVTKAWPVLVNESAGNGGANGGIFAELTAVQQSDEVIVNQMYAYQDTYLGNISGEFTCTKAVIAGLIESGNPSQHLPPQVCPAY